MSGNAIVELNYGTSNQPLVIQLSGLASATQQMSNPVDNSVNLFEDALVQVQFFTATTGVSSTGIVNVYAYGSSNYNPTTLSGTFSVTNGSNSVTTSTSQTSAVQANGFIVFGSQAGPVYIVSAVTSTTITLTSPYTGSTNGSSSAVYSGPQNTGVITFGDTVTGINGNVTLTSPPNLRLIGTINAVADSKQYNSNTLSVAKAFDGTLPNMWGIVVENRSSAAFAQGQGTTTLSGTFTTTNGSTSVTASTSQASALSSGDIIVFSNQPGVPYYITGSVTTSITLTAPFSGTGGSGQTAISPSLTGTMSVTNGSTSVTPSANLTTNSALVAGESIAFASQSGVSYVTTAVASGSITLATAYSGTTNASTTGVIGNFGAFYQGVQRQVT